jgi:hypothetical protein
LRTLALSDAVKQWSLFPEMLAAIAVLRLLPPT